jgi:hypothetical protein
LDEILADDHGSDNNTAPELGEEVLVGVGGFLDDPMGA